MQTRALAAYLVACQINGEGLDGGRDGPAARAQDLYRKPPAMVCRAEVAE